MNDNGFHYLDYVGADFVYTEDYGFLYRIYMMTSTTAVVDLKDADTDMRVKLWLDNCDFHNVEKIKDRIEDFIASNYTDIKEYISDNGEYYGQ